MVKHARFRPFLRPAILALALSACSSGTQAPPAPNGPAWTRQPARTVDSGYIVYVASATERLLDQAEFKAQAAAMEDIANECSFAPKGARLEDQYSDTAGVLHQAYAKVAVSFEDCDAAQKAVDPSQIKKLANVAFADQIKRYQDDIDEEAEDQNDQDEVAGVPSPSSSGNPALAETSAPPSPGIQNQTQFFVVRQQVAYAKEVVIFAPPSAYPPNSPAATRFTQAVTPASSSLQAYQAQNPSLKTSPMSWSSLPYKPAVPPLAGVRGARSAPAYHDNAAYRGSSGNSRRSGQNKGRRQNRRKRRRRNG